MQLDVHITFNSKVLLSLNKFKYYSFNTQNLKLIPQITYYQNYCTKSNQIVHNNKDHQILFVGDPSMRRTNPRWQMAEIFSGLTDRHKTWHNGTQ